MFGDSKGRVWMAPFRKSVCYYYQGKIHNPKNDAVLARIRLKGNIESFAEDAKGNILIQERTALHLLNADSSVWEIDSINHQAIRECAAVSRSLSGHFLVQEGKQIFEFSDQGFMPFFSEDMKDISPNYIALNSQVLVYRENPTHSVIKSFITGNVVYRQVKAERHFQHISFSVVDDSLVFMNKSSGTTEFNVHTGGMKTWLPGREVSRVFRDDEGNLWFTTLGKGLYRLNSGEFRNLVIPVDQDNNCSVYAIRKIGNELFIGGNHDVVRRFKLPVFKDSRTGMHLKEKNRILYIGPMKNGDMIIGSDYGMNWRDRNDMVDKKKLPLSVKSVFEMNDNQLLIAASWGAGIFDLDAFRVTDTLLRERCTAIYFRADTAYIGTLNGLYLVKKDGSTVYAGKTTPFLQNRISSITASEDGTLWIGSYNAGLIGYRNGRVLVTITSGQGLTSDICRTLYIRDNMLWAGTDKGLNRIDLGKSGYPVTRYTANDGLGADLINTVFADSPTTYVGTAAGLSMFNEAKTKVSDSCRLYLLAVMNSGKDRIKDTSHLLLPYSDKQVRFEFAAISYKSAGNISYQYRLKGLDESWRTTGENFLEYLTLPSGNYTLELKASNKFGVYSRPISLHFVVITPFWQSTWFYALVIIASLSAIWLFVSLRIRNIRRRQQEKERLSKRMIELEHIALQSQMNPHFIFNCLNSIQQYIFDQDIYHANKFITGFADLIRATLHHSAQSSISLEDEINYLSAYLSLEKLRFKEKMNYSIEIDPAINGKTISIPPMLIQPYVENSIRHGLRHQTDGKGHIKIQIRSAADELSVIIDDNGIGREKARQYKTSEHIEYQSRGMSLTADRVRLINAIHGDSIRIEITDLKDDEGRALGTRVAIHFSNFVQNAKNQAI